VLRRILVPKMEAVTGGRGKLHETLNLHYLPNIITVPKSRRRIRAEHAARMEEIQIFCRKKLKERKALKTWK